MPPTAPLRIETLSGAALLPVLPALHGLRAAVFRTWPYLYDADPEYEASYMRVYVESERAAIVVAFDGERPVGASTCLPMVDESARVVAPFVALGLDPDRFFYFGESVLLPEYRGQGVGVAFFAGREAHARQVSDADFACFCSVRRAPDHPQRPADWVPLDGFWRRRGYAPLPGLACVMSWREVGHAEEMPHELAFWARSLTGAALPPTRTGSSAPPSRPDMSAPPTGPETPP